MSGVAYFDGQYVPHRFRRGNVIFVERPFSVAKARVVSEAFFTGTTVELLPAVRINAKAVGGGRPGSLTKRLRDNCLASAVAV